jgi:4'-phosphopantetheinyl transferase EntD
MIEEILPQDVSVAELFADGPGVALFEEEAAAARAMAESRRREFASGRECARRALAGLGLPAVPLPRGEKGAPAWPDGVVGSITHCAGYRACAVASAERMLTVGIDAEPHEPLPPEVVEMIALPTERKALAALPSGVHWDRVLFSAKESIYKAWFPLARRWLGFTEAAVSIDPAAGTFHARLSKIATVRNGELLTEFAGRWRVSGGLILTAIAQPANRPASIPREHSCHVTANSSL